MPYQNNATEKVYDLICQKIKNKEWLPNDKIWTEQKLVEALNVSRVAVRQAIGKLVATSVLRKVQGSGTFVEEYEAIPFLPTPAYDLSFGDLVHVINFRQNFESGNTVMFVENATDEDILSLEITLEKMKDHIGDREKFFLYDFEFHRIIANGTKNPFIIKIHKYLVDILLQHQHYLYDMIGPDTGLEYHELILKYVKERDAQLASILMHKHLSVTIEKLENIKKAKKRLQPGKRFDGDI